MRPRPAIRRSGSGLPRTGAGGLRAAPDAAGKPRLAPAVADKTRVCVARIGAAHGTGGEVRLWSFTAEPQAVVRYGVLETADGVRAFEIEALRLAGRPESTGPTADCFIARLKGVTDRSAAERLRNLDLYVPRARLPAPKL